jgi:hypothetical protein
VVPEVAPLQYHQMNIPRVPNPQNQMQKAYQVKRENYCRPNRLSVKEVSKAHLEQPQYKSSEFVYNGKQCVYPMMLNLRYPFKICKINETKRRRRSRAKVKTENGAILHTNRPNPQLYQNNQMSQSSCDDGEIELKIHRSKPLEKIFKITKKKRELKSATKSCAKESDSPVSNLDEYLSTEPTFESIEEEIRNYNQNICSSSDSELNDILN